MGKYMCEKEGKQRGSGESVLKRLKFVLLYGYVMFKIIYILLNLSEQIHLLSLCLHTVSAVMYRIFVGLLKTK